VTAGSGVLTAHFCPRCGEQCPCPDAQSSAGPEEEEIVTGCTHQCEPPEDQEAWSGGFAANH
jgi:hypothetical protein